MQRLTVQQFRCQPNTIDKIVMIKETTTCAYLMVIDIPKLCNDIAFLPPQETKPHKIACTPVLQADAIPSYLAAKESLQAQADAEDDRLTQELIDAVNLLETGQIPLPRIRPDVVGDIEVGAHKLIPKDFKLEKGVIVGGGKETLIATIARDNGYMMDDKGLKKLGFKSGKGYVEELKKQIERQAEGRGWRLDIVKTPRGTEVRGIIETEEKPAKGEWKKVEDNDEGKQEPERKEENEPTGEQQGEQPGDQQEQGSEEKYKDEL